MLETRDIPFRNLPGYSRIYLEYLDQSPAAFRFYHRPPTITSLAQFAREGIARLAYARTDLAAILERQNAVLGAGDRTFEHIRDLKQADCAAVVTGQQAGLFTGPLYTIYKALAAIRIAEELRSSGVRAVPVFWVESEDHDLAEVTRATVIGPDSAVHRLDFCERLYGACGSPARPVATLTLPAAIRPVLEEFTSLLPNGEHLDEVRSLLESAYLPGSGFADAFGRLMTRLFFQRGLIIFNPADPEAKRLVAPVFLEALRNQEEIHRILAERSEALEAAGFHSQVSLLENSTVLFFREDDDRRALVKDGARFSLKNTGRSFTQADLLKLAEQAPERFSPNVLLRPLIQDHLFPTVAYVGGPSEVAYFAQIEVLYRLLGRPMPAIWPRPAFTLLEPEVCGVMEESEIRLTDCLQGRQFLTERIASRAVHSRASAKIRSLGEELERTLAGIRCELVFAEASLGAALDTAMRKMLHNVETLRAKLIQHEAAQDGALSGKIDLVLNHCYPLKNLQEREFGAPVFLTRHGLGLLDDIYAKIRIEHFTHRVITL